MRKPSKYEVAYRARKRSGSAVAPAASQRAASPPKMPSPPPLTPPAPPPSSFVPTAPARVPGLAPLAEKVDHEDLGEEEETPTDFLGQPGEHHRRRRKKKDHNA